MCFGKFPHTEIEEHASLCVQKFDEVFNVIDSGSEGDINILTWLIEKVDQKVTKLRWKK